MTSIAIWGGTGYAGSAIAREALARGFAVTAFARNAPSTPIDGVVYRQASLADVAAVEEAADHDVVVVAVHATGEPSLDEVLDSLVKASRTAGSRLSFVGGAASSFVDDAGTRLLDSPDFPAEYKAEASAHAEVLDRLGEEPEGLDWFYVSPAAVFGAWAAGEATGSYRIGGDRLVVKDDGTSEISGADFALAFVDEIAQPRHPRRRFTVGH